MSNEGINNISGKENIDISNTKIDEVKDTTGDVLWAPSHVTMEPRF